MTHRTTRFVAALLAAVLPFAFVASAGAAPAEKSRADAGATLASNRIAARVADIPGAPIPASSFQDTIVGSTDTNIENEVYSFALADNQVLKASIVTSDPVSDYIVATGWDQSATTIEDWETDWPIAFAEGPWSPTMEIYIPAETGAGTYYLGIENLSDVAVNYTVTYSISTKAPAVTSRLSGNDRFATAASAAKAAWPGWAGVTDVIIASGEDRAAPDPLCAAGLAGAMNAPVLLVKSTLAAGKLPAATERALSEIRAANGGKVRLHVIGGPVAVPAAVYNRVAALKGSGGSVERISARDRYELSAVMAKRANAEAVKRGKSVPFVMIANGENVNAFYDALAASPVSFYQIAPTMLSKTTSVPSTVKNALTTTFAGKACVLISSPSYLSSAVYTQAGADDRIVQTGTNRIGSAFNIATWAYDFGLLKRNKVAVANKLPDALTGGVAMGKMGGPVLYSGAAELDVPTDLFLYWNKGGYTNAYALGGTASLSNVVTTMMNEMLAY